MGCIVGIARLTVMTLSVAACAGRLDAPITGLAGATLTGQIEPVYAAAIARDHAVFWVTSNGCTTKHDLQPVVSRSDRGSIITLRRIKDDRCLSPQPHGLELRWSFAELGLPSGARLSVENPAQVSAPST